MPWKSITQTVTTILLAAMLIDPSIAWGQSSIAARIQLPAEAESYTLVNLVSDVGGQLGLIVGVPSSLGDLTLKRGTVGAMPDGSWSISYEAQLSQGSAVTPLIEMDLGLGQVSGNSASSPSPFLADIRLESSDSISEMDPDSWPWQVSFLTENIDQREEMQLIFLEAINSVNQQPGDILNLSFIPSSSTDQLRGKPSYLFNSPAPGEDLVLTLPPLAPGSLFEEELTVYGASAEAQIRVKIKHEI